MENECYFLVILKPDAIRRGIAGKIISTYEKKGFQLKSLKKCALSRDYLLSLYEDLKPEIFDQNCDFMQSGDCIVSIWYGNVLLAKKLAGKTDPLQRDENSIRGKYSNSLRFNVVHCSDSVKSAKKEFDLTRSLFF